MTHTKIKVVREKSVKNELDGMDLKSAASFLSGLADTYGPDAYIDVSTVWNYDEYVCEIHVKWLELETDAEFNSRLEIKERMLAYERKRYEELKKKFDKD